MKKFLITMMIGMYAISSFAQKPAVVANDKAGWHKLGSTVVNFKTDRDSYVIMGKDKFKAIKFKVMDAGIDLQDLEVYYENDGKNSSDMNNKNMQETTTATATSADG